MSTPAKTKQEAIDNATMAIKVRDGRQEAGLLLKQARRVAPSASAATAAAAVGGAAPAASPAST
jgi:hypothetical protein